MKPIKKETAAKIIACLIIFVFIALVFAQAGKKFVLDELDFPAVAKATSESWRPVYYRGEGTPEHIGLYHPPLYIYALASYIKLFGFSENTIRSFGLLCTLLTTFLTIGIASRLLTRERLQFFVPLFCGLYLLNPYTIANTTLPDIDQTVLPVLMTLFAFLLFEETTSNKLLALVFGLLLWAKLTTPLVLVPFAFIYWSIQGKSPVRSLLKSLAVFGSGAMLFFVSYWIYCKAVDLPLQYTFQFLLHSFTKGGDSGGFDAFFSKIAQNFSNSPALVGWMTLPFVFLFVASTVMLGQRQMREWESRKILLLAGLSVFITVFYCGLISPFGGFFKYPFPAFQFACLTVAFAITGGSKTEAASSTIGSLPIVAFALAAAVIQMTFWKDQSNMGLTSSPRNLALAALVLGILFGLALIYQAHAQKIMYGALSIAVGVCLGMGLGISRTQAIATYPTKYYYGQRGIDETVAYLKEQLVPGEVIWSMKDVGFYSGNHYEENYGDFFSANGKERVLELSKSKVRFFVGTKQIGEDRIDVYQDIQAALDECCILVKNFGNYYIYKARR